MRVDKYECSFLKYSKWGRIGAKAVSLGCIPLEDKTQNTSLCACPKTAIPSVSHSSLNARDQMHLKSVAKSIGQVAAKLRDQM